MKLRGATLKELAAAKGLSVEQLAAAIAEPGFGPDRAASALRNWIMGRDHPRCTTPRIRKLAEVLGVSPKDLARFTSKVMHHRGSPRKCKLLVDMIRGKSVEQAVNMLAFTPQRAALNVKKALEAAREEAMLNDADVTRLIVAESTVTDGPRIKRFQPKDRGRAHPIIKRLSHITIGLEERTAKKKK